PRGGSLISAATLRLLFAGLLFAGLLLADARLVPIPAVDAAVVVHVHPDALEATGAVHLEHVRTTVPVGVPLHPRQTPADVVTHLVGLAVPIAIELRLVHSPCGEGDPGVHATVVVGVG